MSSKTKQLQLFMTEWDERQFIEALRREIPDLRLVDGSRWDSPVPPARERLSECTAHVVYLWSPGIYPELPSRPRGGRWDGPSAGVVIQFQRSVQDGPLLKAGALSAGFDDTDERFAEFVSTTWECLRRSTKGGLRRLDGTSTRIHRVGPQAAALNSSARLFLRDYSAEVYYKVR